MTVALAVTVDTGDNQFGGFVARVTHKTNMQPSTALEFARKYKYGRAGHDDGFYTQNAFE